MGELREAGPLGTLRNAWYQSIDYVRTVWLSLGDLIRGAVSLNDMAGPIGIFAMAGEVGQQGAAAAGMAGALLNIFSFVALIAINLAVMNLLPIPALDGGQILFLLVGGIYHFFTHRRIDRSTWAISIWRLLLPHCPDGGGGRQRRKQIDPVGRLVL